MLTAHHIVAFLVLASCVGAAAVAFVAYRRASAGRAVAHLLALAQTIVVAQVGLGMLLVAGGRRADDDLHYAYGTFALLAVLAPWLYAPAEPRRRLLWFGGSTLVAGALGARAYMTAG
jgi:hypothetical protein